MSTPYAGTPVFPVDFTIPDDADPPTAAAFNVAAEALGDRTAYLKAIANHAQTAPTSFTSALTEWTAGTYDFFVDLEGYGGGGGGGGGARGDNIDDTAYVDGGGSPIGWSYASGGGGGGGALKDRKRVEVTPGTIYEILVGVAGAGGNGATSVTSATAGGDGGDTIFRRKSDGLVLARFKGAKGGAAGVLLTSLGQAFPSIKYSYVIPGGSPTAQFRRTGVMLREESDRTTYCFGPGFGGDGATFNQTYAALPAGQPRRNGADSREGHAGGIGGIPGTNAASGPNIKYRGGGPGGGGAAGPDSAGLDGLDGGAGSLGSGSPGASPSGGHGGNSGAGGGGGGGGGCGASGGGNGSNGISGFDGLLKLKTVL